MKHHLSFLRPALIAIAVLTILPAAAQSTRRAQWVINRGGDHILRQNIEVAQGDAIVVQASGVRLDLGGRSISTLLPGTGRGIVVEDGASVEIFNGKVGGFNANVVISGSENVTVTNVQVTGGGLAPSGGPTEIGMVLIDSRACVLRGNTISSVNLGIFVRGGGSAGNRIQENVVVGGATAANNLLGICYNPAPGAATPAGPRGDSIYNNHIARFGFAVAVSEQSLGNAFIDNTLASFTGPFREPQAFESNGGTNVEGDNTSTVIPADNL
jgi:parallel beta-helix repeat protein